ncbi:MAG: LysR family transcriptional regulator, partial [Oscillospiraceae bacterium]|nr:LysR family transcriptional regulator [Oscillospiraceae bacterium]
MSASFDLYKVFYYVGKFKNITHAAAALFVSQSTVSRSIQSLESELGCRLFDRHRHGVTLTVEGEALYEHISKACEDIFLGEEKLLSRRRLSEYELKIGLGDITMVR